MSLSQSTHNDEISSMFNSIAPRYDLLNRLLSFKIDYFWRRAVIKKLKESNPDTILDLASGTADLAILEAKKINNSHITGIDIAENMLAFGKEKVKKKGLTDRITLLPADGQNLPFESSSFAATTIAFGLRNYAFPIRGIEEMFRVVKLGGVCIILEFSMPKNIFFTWIYKFYFNKILPVIGKLISKNTSAYTYLPQSVLKFDKEYDIQKIMKEVGFVNISKTPLTLGIASMYVAQKL